MDVGVVHQQRIIRFTGALLAVVELSFKFPQSGQRWLPTSRIILNMRKAQEYAPGHIHVTTSIALNFHEVSNVPRIVIKDSSSYVEPIGEYCGIE